jgi:hypothetical protein
MPNWLKVHVVRLMAGLSVVGGTLLWCFAIVSRLLILGRFWIRERLLLRRLGR